MGIGSYLRNSASEFRSEGIRGGAQIAARDLLFGVYHNLPFTWGTPIFDREWDVIVILDACRPDLMDEVADEYDFLPEKIPTVYSVASATAPWMEKNFTEEYRDEMANAAYVTGNPYSDTYCIDSEWARLDEVWKYAWDDEVGSIPARAVTDRAIATAREFKFDRLIVHYMQPHFPSFPKPIDSAIDLETFGREWDPVWNELESGALSKDKIWDSYRANLRYVLDSVELLLQNLDANQVVLSADHGNLVGEWGLYGHPINKPVPVLRRVPWVSVPAADQRGYELDYESKERSRSSDVTQQLRDLGYLG